MASPRKPWWKHLKHTFVASVENDRHPHLLRREAVLGVLILAILIEGAVFAQEFITFRQSDYLASVLPGVVTALTNDARSESHLAVLTPDPGLARAAQAKADDMSAKGYFSHVSPDGTLPWHWFTAAGYDYTYAGENLAVNFGDSEQLVDAWLASPAHRANILGTHFTSIGIGMATGTYEGKSTLFVVEFFAKPAGGAKLAAQPAPTALKAPEIAKATAVPATVPVVTEKGGATEPVVLGVQDERVSPVAAVLASPLKFSAYAFGAIILAFLLAIGLGLVFHLKLPRFSALTAGLVVIAVMLGLGLLNRSLAFPPLEIPADAASANVLTGLTLPSP
ncbi:MAG: CAP domain-containing protein [bacterium]